MTKTICVDLDGTLVRSDLLHECFLQAIRLAPATAFSALLRLREGKAAFKRSLTEKVGSLISIEHLPFNEDVIDYLKGERARGCRIELVSGSDQMLVDRVAEHLCLFDAGYGSDGRRNLSGAAKAAFLRRRHPQGFVYVGGDRADLAPWMAADEAVCVNTAPGLLRELRSRCDKVTEIAPRSSAFRAVLRGMRLHQWGKNVLLFTPLFLALSQSTISDVLYLIVAFLAFGLVASATYLFNDLFDIEADRQHAKKRRRPFASGHLPIMLGGGLGLCWLAIGFGLGAVVGIDFLVILAIYTLLTLAYSTILKTVPVLDVLVLGVLFYLRLQAGADAIEQPVVPWLAIFSLLFFSSLAFAKRYVEMIRKPDDDNGTLLGRGYQTKDSLFVLGFGAALAVGSLLVFLLYAFSGQSQALSTIDVAMACLGVISYWIMRIWFLAARGELDDDPVLFALKDRVSYLLASIVVLALVLDQWSR